MVEVQPLVLTKSRWNKDTRVICRHLGDERISASHRQRVLLASTSLQKHKWDDSSQQAMIYAEILPMESEQE